MIVIIIVLWLHHRQQNVERKMYNESKHSIIIQVEFMNELERKEYWLEMASYDLETAEAMFK
ncbi:MAG: hypothetical protein ACLKAO_12770, partial [Alkaliphilus sp.]